MAYKKGVEALALVLNPIDEIDAGYETLFAELTRLARALGAGAHAEDVAQEALLYARHHIGDLRDPARLRPWLRTMAVRGAARARPASGGHLIGEPQFVPVDRDLGIDAVAAITRLPPRERQIVVLVYGLGYAQEEAAEMLGISRGTIGASLWKARQRLARDLAVYRREDAR